MSDNKWTQFFRTPPLKGIDTGSIPESLIESFAIAAEHWEQGEMWDKDKDRYVPVSYPETETQAEPEVNLADYMVEQQGQGYLVVHKPTGNVKIAEDMAEVVVQIKAFETNQ